MVGKYYDKEMFRKLNEEQNKKDQGADGQDIREGPASNREK